MIASTYECIPIFRARGAPFLAFITFRASLGNEQAVYYF
jgi:hypothetical protein